MRHLTFALIALPLTVFGGQSSDPRLDRALALIERHDVSGLRRLLQEDPSLVRRTEAGVLPHWRWTLLHVATAGTSPLEIVTALVDAGSDVNAKDNEGNTPLHFAMKRIGREKLPARDYEGIIRLLIATKADVRVLNIGGATPLHTASAFRADPSGVELLLQAGAEVNLKTFESYGGWTPLHGATARNSAGMVTVLLKHGADRTATDAKAMTPLQVAEQGGFADAAKVLRAANAPAATAPAAATRPPAPTGGVAASPTAPGATTGGVVQGRVLWNGQPVAGATAFVGDSPPGPVRHGTATTDDQGRFSISGVPAGNRSVVVRGDPRVFGMPGSATFTMTASPFTQDFHLCKVFEPVSPSNNESVAGRPVLRWEPYPDAVRYYVVVLLEGTSVYTRGGPQGTLTATSFQVDSDLAPGSYQWRLFAYNAAGQMIGCAIAPRSFTVRP